MSYKLVNIGFGNSIVSTRVIAIISPNAAPIKRLRDEARKTRGLSTRLKGEKQDRLSSQTATMWFFPPSNLKRSPKDSAPIAG